MWNGKANRSIDDSFYRRPAWKKCRSAFIKYRESIDGGMCMLCREAPGKIVHHRVHLNETTVNDPDIAYGFGNLEYVCLACHNLEHGYVKKLPEGSIKYLFDANGNPVPTQ